MNSTASLLEVSTLKHDENVRPQQLGLGPVPAKRPKPTISQLAAVMDAFNIRGTARLVAYELLRYWEPGGKVFPFVKTIAGCIGKSERVVQRQLEHLERVGIWVRCGRADVGVKGKQPSLFEMRLPKSSGVTPASPHGVTPTSPRSNQREVDVQKPPPPSPPADALPKDLKAIEGGRLVQCRRCQHPWPRAAGLSHICVDRSEKPQRTRKDRARPLRDSAVRSRKIDQARREWKRIESVSSQGGEG